jgi:hypothetical protein
VVIMRVIKAINQTAASRHVPSSRSAGNSNALLIHA